MDATAPQPEAPSRAPAAESPAQAREAYAKTKQELIEALAKKRTLDKQLMQCEVSIYNYEAQYLTETAGTGGGNIIQGFEGYLKNQNVNKRRLEISEADRMFSNSSSTYSKSLELQADDSDDQADTPGKYSAAGLQTVMLPPAPRQETPSAAQQKKERDRIYQRNKRARKDRGTASGDENEYTAPGTNKRKRRAMEDD